MSAGGRGLTRRGLLGAGGSGALGALLAPALSGTAAAQESRAPAGETRNALLIVTSNTRADFVGAFADSDELAETPNLDALAKDSLRFEHAVAESMPTVPARRALLTGMRSYPFRDWRRTEGLEAEPGWNPIRDRYQPIVSASLEHGVLRLELPKAEHTKPRTIRVNGVNGMNSASEPAIINPPADSAADGAPESTTGAAAHAS